MLGSEPCIASKPETGSESSYLRNPYSMSEPTNMRKLKVMSEIYFKEVGG